MRWLRDRLLVTKLPPARPDWSGPPWRPAEVDLFRQVPHGAPLGDQVRDGRGRGLLPAVMVLWFGWGWSTRPAGSGLLTGAGVDCPAGRCRSGSPPRHAGRLPGPSGRLSGALACRPGRPWLPGLSCPPDVCRSGCWGFRDGPLCSALGWVPVRVPVCDLVGFLARVGPSGRPIWACGRPLSGGLAALRGMPGSATACGHRPGRPGFGGRSGDRGRCGVLRRIDGASEMPPVFGSGFPLVFSRNFVARAALAGG